MSRRGAGRYRAIVHRGYNVEDLESTLELASKPIPTTAPDHVVFHITIWPIHPIDMLAICTCGLIKHGLSTGAKGFGIVELVSHCFRLASNSFLLSLPQF